MYMSPRLKEFQARTKTQTILQMENAECGAACLAMILGYHEKHVKLSSLRKDCGVSRDGVKASNIVKAARNYGLQAAGYKRSCKELRQSRTPSILYWEFNHFVVLEGFCRKGVFINDPAIGHRLITHDNFSKAFTGVVLEFKPTDDFKREGSRFNILPGLASRCREHRGVLAYLIITSVLSVVPVLAVALATSVFTDRILSRADEMLLQPVLTTVALASGALILLTFVYQYYLRRLQIGLSISMGSKFIHHLLRLPTDYFEQRGAGEVISREQLNDNVADVISEGVVQTANDLVSMLIFCAVMFLLSVKLTLTAIAFTLPLYLYMRWSAASRTEASMAVAMEKGKESGIVIEGVSALEAYKANGQESAFFARWASTFSSATEKQQQLSFTNLLPGIVNTTLTQAAMVIVLMMGALQIMNGAMSLGEVIAFQALMAGFTRPLDNLSKFYSQFQQLRGEMERLDDVLEHPVDPGFKVKLASGVTPDEKELTGKLELKNVSFRYSAFEALFIENVSLSVAPGQRVALVGASGSGKSTLAKIAAGACQAEQGQITLDGHELTDWPKESLAQAVAMITQDPFFIEGNLRDNLTLWDATIADDKIIAACKDAEIWDVIEALPAGLVTVVAEEGSNFSGGERQRLEIARALIREPRLLILDEATSALDSETENRIDQNLRLCGCSCLIVAHRLSTVRDCDRIIVLAEGEIVASGTHDELWSVSEEYRDLYTADKAEIE